MLKPQPATPALARYLNDHHAFLSFNAYLWRTIVIAQYGRARSPDMPPIDPAPPEDARSGPVHEMKEHTQYLSQMTFCRGVDSFLVYVTNLLTMIFEARPEILKSKQQTVSVDFVLEHLAAEDLIQALVERKVNELSYLGMKDVADFFQRKLHLPLFAEEADLIKATIYVDMRNLITHNRGIVNRIFKQRQPAIPAEIGTQIEFEDGRKVAEILGFLVYCARELDARAAPKFDLETVMPIAKDPGAV
jgi:hypothetical protein